MAAGQAQEAWPALGIIAGGGSLPARLAAAAQSQGRRVFVLALQGHADAAALEAVPQEWIRLGEAGRAIALLRKAGVREVVMAGPVRRPALSELYPDWRTLRFFARLGFKALGDDGLLKAVIGELESEGFCVIGAQSVLGDLLARPGVWGKYSPDLQAKADIEHGLRVALGLGALDIGQSVVVQQGIVLGVEAIEGTDALIERCGRLARQGAGGVLIKIAKPGQERRVDLPTIGTTTIQNLAKAGLRGIAVEAGATLVVEENAVVAAADAAGLFVIGLDKAAE